MRTTGSTSRTGAIAKAARSRPWRASGGSSSICRRPLLDQEGLFRYGGEMRTQTIEIDDDTATALKQRAEERGVSVAALVAELAALEASPAEADRDDIAELDRRWQAFQ